MDFTGEDHVRDNCLRLGRKLGWLNVVLADKIEAFQKEIRLREANGISKSCKLDLSSSGKREVFPVGVDKASSNYDTVDCRYDIHDNDVGSDDDVDNGGKIDDSVIILGDDEDDDVGYNNNSNNGVNHCDNVDDNSVDVDANNVDNGGKIDSSIIILDDDDDDDDIGNNNSNNGVNHRDNVDDSSVDVDANIDDNDENLDDSDIVAEDSSGGFNNDNDDNGVDDDGNIDDEEDVIDESDFVAENNHGFSHDSNGDDDGVDIGTDVNASIGDGVDGAIFNENGDDDNNVNDDSHDVVSLGSDDMDIDGDGVVSPGSDDVGIDNDNADDTDGADDNDKCDQDDICDDSDDASDNDLSGDGNDENDSADGFVIDAGVDGSVVANDTGRDANKDKDDGCAVHVFDNALGDITASDGDKYNAARANDDHDDEDGGIEYGGIIYDSKNNATDEHCDNSDNEHDYDNISGSIHDCGHDNHCDNHRNQSDVVEPNVIANSLEMMEEIPTADCKTEFDFLNDAAQVSEDDEETHQSESYPVDDCKIVHSMDKYSEKACGVDARNLSNGEETEDACIAEITRVPQFVESYHPGFKENYGIETDCQDGSVDASDTFQGDSNCKVKGDDDDSDDNERNMKCNDMEEERDVVKLFDSADDEVHDNSDLLVMSRPASSMTDCGKNDDDNISDSPVKASLSARLFKKYNPEKSESDVDDFEMFLQKIRTPKKLLSLSGEEGKRETKSLEEFIVDDDDDELEEDVFVDPGFTPEEYDSDKENESCFEMEMATPVSSCTPFKTPLTNFPSKTPKSTKSYTAPCSHSKGKLDNLLASYASEKDFKRNREPLARDLFQLYNCSVFDNQLPSDFQITWNKRMRSTAGFCYYSRKNGVRMSRIELADKVIDSTDRLRDTLIHEMCHAASWIISGVKAGHGPVWKSWAMRSNFVHQDLPPISRCHSYTINTKYTYRCTKCQNTFGRHSKSVNLEESRCAHCHSRLELVPQLKKDGTPQTRTPSRFALFVKENFARIKKDNENFTHQEVMTALSSEFGKLST